MYEKRIWEESKCSEYIGWMNEKKSRRQLVAAEEECLVMDLEKNERYYKPAAKACRRTHCKHTAEDDLEVFSIDDLGLDWISVYNFLTRLQKLSSYASGHLEVSELAACLEKASFSNTSGHDEVF
ncbi:hypothetical protein Tco_0025809 [Tanacetum coccineum]